MGTANETIRGAFFPAREVLPLQQGTILLVEDDPDDAELTIRALGRNRVAHPVALARDGAEALEQLLGEGPSVSAAMPALVLLDLSLPKVPGLEVLRRIRADERTRLLPVIILTSSQRERDLISGYRLGANAFVRKPVHFSKLADAARQMGLEGVISSARVCAKRGERRIGAHDAAGNLPPRGEDSPCRASGIHLAGAASPRRFAPRERGEHPAGWRNLWTREQ